MKKTLHYLGPACVGVACLLLQPKQPQSVIATAFNDDYTLTLEAIAAAGWTYTSEWMRFNKPDRHARFTIKNATGDLHRFVGSHPYEAACRAAEFLGITS